MSYSTTAKIFVQACYEAIEGLRPMVPPEEHGLLDLARLHVSDYMDHAKAVRDEERSDQSWERLTTLQAKHEALIAEIDGLQSRYFAPIMKVSGSA